MPQSVFSLVAAAIVLVSVPTASQVPTATYDLLAEVTVAGTISSVETADKDGVLELIVVINAVDGELKIHVGPVAFVAANNAVFWVGDEITVTGSRTTLHQEAWILAREIAKSGRTLTLRSLSGAPLWQEIRRIR